MIAFAWFLFGWCVLACIVAPIAARVLRRLPTPYTPEEFRATHTEEDR